LGTHLTVGGKDHGAMMQISYTLSNGNTVVVILPGNALLTLIVILPVPAGGQEHYTVVLNS